MNVVALPAPNKQSLTSFAMAQLQQGIQPRLDFTMLMAPAFKLRQRLESLCRLAVEPLETLDPLVLCRCSLDKLRGGQLMSLNSRDLSWIWKNTRRPIVLIHAAITYLWSSNLSHFEPTGLKKIVSGTLLTWFLKVNVSLCLVWPSICCFSQKLGDFWLVGMHAWQHGFSVLEWENVCSQFLTSSSLSC